jgi:cyclic beta-1,2-glucan synthetase
VITLDSDTRLPLEAGRRLVGALAHPLNRPRFDARVGRVTEGYGILQPRVQVSVESATRTAFAQVFAGHVGLDPYTTAVSDVYQDLFHEGSFVGKGIYDVDAFIAALDGRVPENTLLSHDLFEGFYARAGLCTDIELVDDFPSNYLAFAARMHRWVRGDWQIARWLARTVPTESGAIVRNTLPAIARWKILDNLRRSLIAPALVVLFVAGWMVLPGSPLLWSALAILVLTFPAYIQVGRSLGSRFRGVPLREHFLAERDNLATSARQAFLSTVFLLHLSGVMLDAIGRTLYRLLFTRRRLLEWVTADRSAHVEASPSDVSRKMRGTLLIPALLAIALGLIAPGTLPLAAPVLVLWSLSPAIAYATGRSLKNYVASLSRAERTAFRRTARKVWRFFEEFVGPGDHWLVPDNIQENRRDLIAHRTSPTNIGLQLLSALAAHDFGYLTLDGLLSRLEPTFATLLRMQRYRGHFYNWYDTQTLAPLAPAYISTVDSGNLAGHLVTLRTALTQLTEANAIVDATFLYALDDLAELVGLELAQSADGDAAPLKPLRKELGRFRAQLTTVPTTIDQWMARLPQLADRLSVLGVLLHELEEPLLAVSPKTSIAEAAVWLDRAAAAVADRITTLNGLLAWTLHIDVGDAGTAVPARVPSVTELVEWCDRFLEQQPDSELRVAVEESKRQAFELIERAERLGIFADDLVEETEFDFLFDPERQLFTIGFNVSEGRLDNSYYDTLASEARLASFLAIATGKISRDHWFKLGRSLTPSGHSRALLSWSASMFEYLMPVLIMRAYPGTLLDETYRAVVERQIQYATARSVPWGISESAYFAQDLDGNYQYRAFGVPGLGLKRGLADDLVIAPYASILAASIMPAAVHANLERLAAEGMAGRYGFYEAIDYTTDRLPKHHVGGMPLLTYMAHHQGMSLLALDNAVNAAPMQDRFHADRRVQAAELLLQERLPNLVPFKNPPVEKADHLPSSRQSTRVSARRYATPHTLSPRTHLLSNGSYGVMVTNAGGGYSRRQGVALTRWREDITTDAWGSFIYLRDLDSKEVWSTTYQPTLREPEEYDVTFAPDRATWRRVDDGIEARTEVVVSPEDDAELRRVSLTNHSDRVRSIELTSYLEVVLAPADADLGHPAFSNLFVETAVVADQDALICTRRPRAGGERLYLFHVISGRGRLGGATEYETDRARFVGRGRTVERPLALYRTAPLSSTTGAVLDPIVSLRQTVRIPPGGTARLAFTTGFAGSAEGARQCVEKYHDRRAVARSLALASTHSQIEMRHLGLTIDETMRFDRLAGRLLYGDPRLRSPEAIRANTLPQSELWKYGISGDMPILLLRLNDDTSVPLFRELVKAHEYLRLRGFAFDLVALNEHASSYLQDLHHTLMQIAEGSPEQPWIDRPGGIFVRRADLMPIEDQVLLRAAARAVMDSANLDLDAQLERTNIPSIEPAQSVEFPAARSAPYSDLGVTMPSNLELFNGSGGFSDDGREYTVAVDLDTAKLPPSSWSNVVANASFGFVASECGPGCTWSVNSHDNRLSPWNNDPVSDTPGEALFLRDEETGRFWSATPLPAGHGGRYVVRHGAGYSVFEHRRHALTSTLVLFVPTGDPVKVFRLTLQNNSKRRRRVTITLYVDWVLGENQTRSHLHVVTSRDPATGAVLARNAFRQDFGQRVAFLDLYPGSERTVTGDRAEFVGRNGRLREPSALRRSSLSDRTGAGLDPCGAIQVSVVLEADQTRTIVGLLGDAADEAGARALVLRYREPARVDGALDEARAYWNDLLGTLTVSTPDRSMDLMLNRWLPYQTLACRIWGRSAFYQSSGAFGFRDQLQDVLALLNAKPDLARAHILHAASRQFVEGDVQHWWHEPGGQGVRTRFSDDRLWLVYSTMRYIAWTGDRSVLDESISFLDGRQLNPGEHESYERPSISRQSAPLYEHCVRAIALNLESGTHGLPLMGTGDWNDGMSLVGAEGRGESVWLGWFLLHILREFAPIAAARGEDDRASQYRRFADRLLAAIEEAWDGAWYRRAYFDDGTPLGSKVNDECRIDAIAQSWAVIAGGGDPARARQAMAAVDEHLVRGNEGLVLLLTPPFDHMVPSPGYIQGYVPGVRENGGQYTHAALWTVLAHAELGAGDRATELFAMINPINHARTPAEVTRYRAEPYVVAADVYSRPPHTGRAGWTWYTGSSGWMYRVGMEAILGLTLRDNALHIDPCIPRAWPRFEAVLKRPDAEWHILVENPAGVNRGVQSIELDGADHTGRDIALTGVSGVHSVRVILG